MSTGARGGFDRAVSALLAIAALSMAGTVVYREFAPGAAGQPSGSPVVQEGSYVPGWKDLTSFARPIGDSVAPVALIEFTDLECPACRRFHLSTLPELRRMITTEFSLALVHLPLSGHRFAKAAAQAAECSAEQGRFGDFVDVVMAKQDSIGLKPWLSFAREAEVPDDAAFSECTARPGLPAFVDSGMVAADRLQVFATPTVLVNGWRVGSPSAAEIARVIGEVAANRPPYPRKGVGTGQR